MRKIIRTYSELMSLESFEDRYEYLRLGGKVGVETFGFERYLNQQFYKSDEWLDVRDHVIIRDNGYDLGHISRKIPDGVRIIVHHMNSLTTEDITHKTKYLLDPEYLISTIDTTHRAIHYGDRSLLMAYEPIERKPHDTCLWTPINIRRQF